MTWRDNLIWADASNVQKKKASFRGAEFFVRDVSSSFGRRNVAHQYPFKDKPYVEDLGEDTEEFQVNGYVVQNEENDFDYFAARDALINALRAKGPGTLIHPFYGDIVVSLSGKARIAESFSPGGIAYFSMTFTKVDEGQGLGEKSAPVYPKSVEDHQDAVDNAVEAAEDDTADGFGSVYAMVDNVKKIGESVTRAVSSLNSMLKSTTRLIQGAGPAMVSRALAYAAQEFAGINTSTINDACSLASGITGMFNGLKSISGYYGELVTNQLFGPCTTAVRGINNGPWSGAKVSAPSSGYVDASTARSSMIDETFGKTIVEAMLAVCDFGTNNDNAYGGNIDEVTVTTDLTARQSANLVAITNLVRNTAILNAAKTAVRIDYGSYDSAMATMNKIVEALEAQLLKLGNDAADDGYDDFGVTVSDPYSYQALESLRPIFVEAMKGIGEGLAKIVSYSVPPDVTPSLLIAYDLYEDLDREAEIIQRNTPLVKHPGFLPSGYTIELLSE